MLQNIIESFLVDIGIAVNPETLKQSEKDLNKNKQNVQKTAADIDKANKGNADTHKKASDEIKKNNESVGKSNLVLSKEFVDGVTAMGKALTDWVMGIQAVAKEYEGLYYAQKRGVGEGADIKAFGSSISKMGGDADDATQSLESLAQKMRQNPGEEGLLQSIGVQTRDAKGQLKGVAEMMPDLADQFAKMPYYMAAQYAQAMGISERTMMAMRSNPAEFRKHQDEYRAQLKAMGLDVNQAEQASKDFDNSLRGVQEQFQIAGSILAIKVMPVLNRITDWMQKNPKTVQAIAVGLAALSAAAIGLGVAMGVASLATTAFTLAASPVLWLVMAIIAIIGGLIAAYQKWGSDIGISFDWKGFAKLIHGAGDEVNYVSQKILELLGNYKSWAEAKQDFLKGLHGESDPTANIRNQVNEANRAIMEKTTVLIPRVNASIAMLEAIPTESNLKNAKEQRNIVEPQGAGYRAGEFVRGAEAAFLNLLSRGESVSGSYNSYNSGTINGKVIHSGKYYKPITGMTINEVIAAGNGKDANDPKRIRMAGRYQMMTGTGGTLDRVRRQIGLTGNEMFDEKMQDKLALATLPKATQDYITKRSDDVQAALIGVAQVWRSVADPRTGKTYADRYSQANRASISSKEVANALNAMRELNRFSLGVDSVRLNRASNSNVSFNTTNNITVNSTSDARENARLIEGTMAQVNQRHQNRMMVVHRKSIAF